jgi:crotonobetainyl-CoA:carnitine CoA-transferase CaiB-like acyl-CoA transferase
VASALDGIRVVDLTVWFQGPVCSQHLADFGAEVIHVERPDSGDQGRGVRSIKALPMGDWNHYFGVTNRNKKSLALNLKKKEGREILYQLIGKSDVFLSNLTPERLEGMDLTYEKLSEINPRLVYTTNTGYGRRATVSKPSFDLTVQALTGLMARLGEPGQPPVYLGMGSGDALGGLMSALGIVLALHQRLLSGKGQHVDASLYGAQLYLAAPMLQAFLATGKDRYSEQQARRAAPNPLWNRYAARDKWLFLCVENDDASWLQLCETLGDSRLSQDPRFATADGRRQHAAKLTQALDEVIAKDTAQGWLERWKPLGITASPIQNMDEVSRDPQAWENDYFAKIYSVEAQREVTIRGLPVTLGKTPAAVESLGPELGQDTELILADTLGLSWDRIGELKAQGVIP